MQDDLITYDPRIPKCKPIISSILIVIMIIMFFIEILFSALYNDKAIIFLGAKWNEGITNGEYWRFITCTFLHGSFIHLFLNVFAIYIFGQEVESLFGNFRFLLTYLISSWGASLTSYVFSNEIAIGASGAVFGIIASLVVFFYKQREKVSGANLRYKSMYTLIIINLVFGFFLPRIDNAAHIGGTISGLVSSYFISPEYKIQTNETMQRSYVIKELNISRLIAGTFFITLILCLLTYASIMLNN